MEPKILLTAIPIFLGIVKYAHTILTNKHVKDDWLGHLLLAIGLITLILGLVGFFKF